MLSYNIRRSDRARRVRVTVDRGGTVEVVLPRRAPERAAELNDDAAALAYACEIVRELMQGLAYADRSSPVKVRDETRQMVFSIPFFAARA